MSSLYFRIAKEPSNIGIAEMKRAATMNNICARRGTVQHQTKVFYVCVYVYGFEVCRNSRPSYPNRLCLNVSAG
jgi:hypothetical protein